MFFRRIRLFFVLMALSLELPNLNSETLTCNPDDLRALNGFSNRLESTSTEWNTTDSPGCCTWTGVTCDNSTGFDKRVVGLELGSKRLVGKICGSLAGLNQLRALNFSHNFLQGSLPDELFSLPNIDIIDISNNDFVGSINNKGMCTIFTRIQVLNFSNNQFYGEVPKGLENCASLQHLSFDENSLLGSLPESLFQLQNLSELNLQGNLSNLVKLDISSNLFFGVNSPSLQLLNLDNNSLNGPINLNCLGSNLFHGLIPNSLFSCRGLKALNLGRNNLGGKLPNNLKNLKSLTQLSLSNTSLSNILSALRILQHCRNLSMLGLTRNFHDEQIPNEVSLEFKNLNSLILANCQLRGPIPQWLSGCHNLQFLDLSWNHLGGNIPSWVGKFNSLFYLDLSNNSLKGEIPKSLTELQSLISGKVTIEEPVSSFQLYTARQGGPGLSYRQISSFRLPYSNNLSGMTDLEKLDLSHNKLSGGIPHSLINLSFLSTFNISYNRLCGEIPLGSQFDTFPNASFEGNNGLCHTQCTRQSEQIPVLSIRERKRTIIGLPFKIGAATGFVLTVICCFMITFNNQREPKKKLKTQN
ncbi:hypothetical protein ACJW30_07G068200 [Castanea mollissima]